MEDVTCRTFLQVRTVSIQGAVRHVVAQNGDRAIPAHAGDVVAVSLHADDVVKLVGEEAQHVSADPDRPVGLADIGIGMAPQLPLDLFLLKDEDALGRIEAGDKLAARRLPEIHAVPVHLGKADFPAPRRGARRQQHEQQQDSPDFLHIFPPFSCLHDE